MARPTAARPQQQQQTTRNAKWSSVTDLFHALTTMGTGIRSGIESYSRATPPLLKAIDCYLVFVMFTGVLQALYLLLAGPYPLNAFLGGFGTSITAFVLGANLRSQINPQQTRISPSSPDLTIKLDETETPAFNVIADDKLAVSSKRAVFDFVFANLLLFFFAVNNLG